MRRTENHVTNAAYDHVIECFGADYWSRDVALGAMIDAIWFLIARQYINVSLFDAFDAFADLGDVLQ